MTHSDPQVLSNETPTAVTPFLRESRGRTVFEAAPVGGWGQGSEGTFASLLLCLGAVCLLHSKYFIHETEKKMRPPGRGRRHPEVAAPSSRPRAPQGCTGAQAGPPVVGPRPRPRQRVPAAQGGDRDSRVVASRPVLPPHREARARQAPQAGPQVHSDRSPSSQ